LEFAPGGAKSERIVPSGHSPHQNPQAIEEVRRIALGELSIIGKLSPPYFERVEFRKVIKCAELLR
jgi:hypothetical protein